MAGNQVHETQLNSGLHRCKMIPNENGIAQQARKKHSSYSFFLFRRSASIVSIFSAGNKVVVHICFLCTINEAQSSLCLVKWTVNN